MKRAFRIFQIILILLSFSISLNAQWVQTNGPFGGSVRCYAVSGSSIFEGVWSGGIYFSSNNGTDWQLKNNGLTNKYVNSIAISGSNIFVSASGNGIYRSTNLGESWVPVTSGMSFPYTTSVAVSGTNVFAGSEGGWIYYSSNNGTNWTDAVNGIDCYDVFSLLVSDTKVYVATDNGVFVTTNNGTLWTSTGLGGNYVYTLAKNNTTIYAGTGNGVYISTNDGTNWIQKGTGIIGSPLTFCFSGTNIFAGTEYYGAFVSSNSGNNWTAVNNGLTSKSVYSLAAFGNNIFSGTNAGNFVSSNSGVNWIEKNNNIKNSYVTAFIGLNSNILAGTMVNGTFLSTNNGDNWTKTSNDLTNKEILSFTMKGQKIFAGTYFYGVYFSTNNGQNWFYSGLDSNLVNSLVVSGTDIFAATEGFNGVGRVYLSSNDGLNWISVSSGLQSYSVLSLAIQNNMMFAGTEWNGVYMSTNRGASWLSRNNSAIANYGINNLGILDTNIFAGTFQGVFRANVNSTNWTRVGLVNQSIYCMLVKDSVIYVGTDIGGIFYSTNKGNTWVQKLQGFSFVPSVSSLYIHNDYLFAGVSGNSVWKRNVSNLIGIKNISVEIPDGYSLHQNYPNPFNPSTNIKYQIPKNSFVSLKVFNILGEEIETLVNGKQSAGTYEAVFDAPAYPSGAYFYRLVTDGFTDTKKMILLK